MKVMKVGAKGFEFLSFDKSVDSTRSSTRGEEVIAQKSGRSQKRILAEKFGETKDQFIAFRPPKYHLTDRFERCITI